MCLVSPVDLHLPLFAWIYELDHKGKSWRRDRRLIGESSRFQLGVDGYVVLGLYVDSDPGRKKGGAAEVAGEER